MSFQESMDKYREVDNDDKNDDEFFEFHLNVHDLRKNLKKAQNERKLIEDEQKLIEDNQIKIKLEEQKVRFQIFELDIKKALLKLKVPDSREQIITGTKQVVDFYYVVLLSQGFSICKWDKGFSSQYNIVIYQSEKQRDDILKKYRFNLDENYISNDGYGSITDFKIHQEKLINKINNIQQTVEDEIDIWSTYKLLKMSTYEKIKWLNENGYDHCYQLKDTNNFCTTNISIEDSQSKSKSNKKSVNRTISRSNSLSKQSTKKQKLNNKKHKSRRYGK